MAAAPTARPGRERQERLRFVARALAWARDERGFRSAEGPVHRLALRRGRVVVHGHLAAPGRWRDLAVLALLPALTGAVLLAVHAGLDDSAERWLWLRVVAWALVASSPLALLVSTASWWRSRLPVMVLVDARRGRLRMHVLLSCWEEARRARRPPAVLWVLARGGIEHAALEAAVDLPVRCFVGSRAGFVEVRLSGR